MAALPSLLSRCAGEQVASGVDSQSKTCWPFGRRCREHLDGIEEAVQQGWLDPMILARVSSKMTELTAPMSHGGRSGAQ